jgi:hypothetical protein
MQINDNPFYSEATRVGKQASLNTAANNDINTLTAQQTQQQTQLASLKADAAIKVNAATGQYDINNKAYQQTLQTFNQLMAAGGLANADANTLASYSVATGLPVSMLQSIQQTEAAKNVKTQLFSSDNGTVTGIDANTGQVLFNTKPGVDTTKNATGTGTTTVTATQAQFNTSANSMDWIKSPSGLPVGTFPQLVTQYAAAMSLASIYKMYANSDVGKKWGPPTEPAAYIQNLYTMTKSGG